jgi:uncharacterized protein YjdB
MGTHNFRTFFASAAVTAMVLSVPVSAKAKKGSITKVAVTNLPAKTLTLKKGKKKTLKFKVTKKGKISKALAYKSSNKKVVTVSKKGVVKAKKKGKATVTAYAKANKKKKVAIKIIVGTPVTKIKLNKTKATLKVKKTLKLKATVTPKKASNKKVIWKTSNKKIATVSSAGKVTAKKKGTAKITATAADGSGKKATAKITVKAAAKKKTPVTPTTVAALQVTNPRTVTFALSKAQALDASALKLEAKTTEQANYRHTLKIKSVATTDNVNYTVTLKKGYEVANDAEDHNVRLTVTGLANNTAPVTFETLFRKGKIDKTYTTTQMVEKGDRVQFQAAYEGNEADTYETSALPAGLKQDPNKDGVFVYGTPTNTNDQDITVKETDVYGNTYTQVTHVKFYDDNTVNAYVTYDDDNHYYSDQDAGYYVPTVNDNDTYDNLADDSLNPVSVSAQIHSYGGQVYHKYDSGDEYDDGHYEDKDFIAAKYAFVSGDTTGLTLSDSGKISGKISSSRTVIVRVTKKNKAGYEINDDVKITFNVANAKLVKGTVTDNNGAAVQEATVSAVNNDLSSQYSSGRYGTTNNNGQYDYVLIDGGNYDVTVSRDQSDSFYASQTTADTMNYKLDGVQYNVTVNAPADYYGDVSNDYYDESNNEGYYLYDNYNYDTKAHNATIFTDKPSLTLYANGYSYNGTLTVANGAANVTITKK